jgi:hypothetical protein
MSTEVDDAHETVKGLCRPRYVGTSGWARTYGGARQLNHDSCSTTSVVDESSSSSWMRSRTVESSGVRRRKSSRRFVGALLRTSKSLNTASSHQSKGYGLRQARAVGTHVQDADGDETECSSAAASQRTVSDCHAWLRRGNDQVRARDDEAGERRRKQSGWYMQ